jgi:glycosyltransferase involved in cell wall biosynthesis
VNDGSTDDTHAAASRYAENDSRIKVVSYPENQGKGFALRQGFKASNGDTVIFFDADLDIPPACIPVLLENLETNDLGGVVGSKMHRDSDVRYSLKRKILSHAVRMFVWILFRISVKDTQVGLKVFRRQSLEPIMGLPQVKGFAFDIELLALAQKTGIKIGEGPVRIEYAQQTSTVTLLAVFRALMDAFGIFYRVRIKRTRPSGGR